MGVPRVCGRGEGQCFGDKVSVLQDERAVELWMVVAVAQHSGCIYPAAAHFETAKVVNERSRISYYINQ